MDNMYRATVKFTIVWDTPKSRDISDSEAVGLVSIGYRKHIFWTQSNSRKKMPDPNGAAAAAKATMTVINHYRRSAC